MSRSPKLPTLQSSFAQQGNFSSFVPVRGTYHISFLNDLESIPAPQQTSILSSSFLQPSFNSTVNTKATIAESQQTPLFSSNSQQGFPSTGNPSSEVVESKTSDIQEKYSSLVSSIQKTSAKIDSIKYNVVRKQKELKEGKCTEQEYKSFLQSQEVKYNEIMEVQRKQISEYQNLQNSMYKK